MNPSDSPETFNRILKLEDKVSALNGKLAQRDINIVKLTHQLAKARIALEGINAIRNSIVGLQAFNWSEHAYPLVALLDGIGCVGLEYDAARKFYGTLLERNQKLRHAVQKLCTWAVPPDRTDASIFQEWKDTVAQVRESLKDELNE